MANYYVSTTGNDSNDGSAIDDAHAFLTIAKAGTVVAAGDTVYIKAGNYDERFWSKASGTAGNYITYKNYNGGIVTIGDTDLNDIVKVFDNDTSLPTHYQIYEGLRIMHSDGAGFCISAGSSHIIIRNCYCEDCDKGGVFMIGNTPSYDITIDGLECNNVNTDDDMEAISLRYVIGYEIKNCIIHNSLQNGINPAGCRDGSIHDNVVYDLLLSDDSVGISVGSLIINTYITTAEALDDSETGVDCSEDATTLIPVGSIIRFDSEYALVTATGTTLTVERGYLGSTAAAHDTATAIYRAGMDMGTTHIYNNIVHGCTSNAGMQFGSEATIGDSMFIGTLHIYNNIIYGNRRGIQFATKSTAGFSLEAHIFNNILYCNDADSMNTEIFIPIPDSYFRNSTINNNVIISNVAGGYAIVFNDDDYSGQNIKIFHNLFYNHGKAYGATNEVGLDPVYGDASLKKLWSPLMYIRSSSTPYTPLLAVDARIDDALNTGDATSDGVIDAIRDVLIARGIIAAA